MYDNEVFFVGKHTTLQLEDCVARCNTYEEFERKYSDEFLNDDCRLGYFLCKLLDKYKRSASDVSDKAGLANSYVGLIINGKKSPKRDALISICISICATVEETQKLLRYAGYSPLYVRRKRDVIIWFGIMKQHNLTQINATLAEKGFSLLTKREK